MALGPDDPGYADENKGPLTLTIASVLTSLSGLFVLARLYSRHISTRKLAIDDYICVFCVILGIIYVALAGVAIHYGAGRHVPAIPVDEVMTAVYYIVISFVPGVSSFMFPKFAGIILLARLLNPSRTHRIIMWIVSLFYLAAGIVMLTFNFAQCQPAAAQWGGAEGTCWDRRIVVNYAIFMSSLSVAFDFYLSVYPTIVLRTLQMNWKKKVALCSSLGFGYCAAGVTIYKCVTLMHLAGETDFTFFIDDVVLWTNIEANFVLIGTCIPTLFPLVRQIFGSSALGGSGAVSKGQKPTGDHSSSGPASAFASAKKRAKGSGQFDAVADNDDSKYIILEERSFHCVAEDRRSDDASVLETGRKTPKGW
ncbi:hypothetical protein QBC47DRAFT_452027 [Echria macrotheca]|uniref:Rhodopsin domain-containing protein n=1 Tax=Echria macrotheca TaxID=438768 RepID=A0AAJ0BE91_9PEZI|nr:hypothetical protein QBC47DRAFT_452027 [Echria macrotheca]